MTIPILTAYSPNAKIIHLAAPTASPRPLIVLFYSGGFSVGTIHQLTEPARTFAQRFNAVVVLGEYRMVPEVRWPVPWKDVWELLEYLSRHANGSKFGHAELDLSKGGGFVVGGISAGASIATACAEIDALGLAEREGVTALASRITGLMSNVPFLVVPDILPQQFRSIWTAWKEMEHVAGFNTKALQQVIEGIQCTDYHSCWFSPVTELASSKEVLKCHPRVYVSACQRDPLRDDGKVFCALLQQRGVEAKMDIFPDDGHNGWSVIPWPRNSTNPSFEEAYLAGMEWLLHR